MNLLDLMVKIGIDDKASAVIAGIGNGIAKGLGTAAKVGVAAVGAVGAATIAFGTAAVDAGKQFDSSMSQVAATMGQNAERMVDYNGQMMSSIDALRIFAQEMGATTAFSATQAADALNYMALAGYDAETSMQMLPTVLNLAAAGSIDLALASDMVTDAQSALGLTTEETAAMVDQMAAASSNTNTSVQQLGEAFLTVGATAANMSGSTEELAVILGIMADNGIKGSEAGTHLRNMILSLTNPTDEAAQILQDFNIAVYDSDGNMRDMREILAELQVGMEGMDQASRDAVIAGLFNRTDMAAVNALLNTSADRYDEVTAAIQGSAGAAEQMAAVQLDNLEGDITLFKSALEGVQIALSDMVTPSLREMVQIGTEGLSELTEAMRGIGEEGGFDNLLSVVGDTVGKIVAKVSELLPSFLKVVTSIATSVAGEIPNLVATIIPAITEALPQILEAGTVMLGGLIQAVVDSAPLILDALSEAVVQMLDLISDNMPEMLDTAGKFILEISSAIAEHLPEIVDALLNLLGQMVKYVIDHGPEMLSGALELLSNLTQGIRDSLENVLSAMGEVVLGAIGAVTGAIGDMLAAGRDFLNGMWDGVKEKAESVKTWFSDLPQNLLNALGDVGSLLWDAGSSIISGLWDGLRSAWGGVTEWVGGLGSWIAEHKGPLDYDRRLLVPAGNAIMSGFGESLEDSFDRNVAPFVESLADDLSGTVSLGVAENYNGAGLGAGVVNNYYIDGNLVAADAVLSAALDTVAQRVSGRRRMGVAYGAYTA